MSLLSFSGRKLLLSPPERCHSCLQRGRQLGTCLLAQERHRARLYRSYGPCLVGVVSQPRRTDASQSCDYYAVFIDASLQAAQRSKCLTSRWYKPFGSQCVRPKLGLQRCVTDLRQIVLTTAPKTKQLSSPRLCLNAPFQVCLSTSPTSAEPFSSIRISHY